MTNRNNIKAILYTILTILLFLGVFFIVNCVINFDIKKNYEFLKTDKILLNLTKKSLENGVDCKTTNGKISNNPYCVSLKLQCGNNGNCNPNALQVAYLKYIDPNLPKRLAEKLINSTESK